jgi:hypothetical protein
VHVQVLAIAYLVHADLADRILLVFRERFAWVKRGFGEETLIITFVLSFVLIYKNKQYKYEYIYEEEGNIIDHYILCMCVLKHYFFWHGSAWRASETIRGKKNSRMTIIIHPARCQKIRIIMVYR